MASFPTPNVHRRSRRKLSRGQYPQSLAAVATLTPATAVVTIEFDVPVVVAGSIDLHLVRSPVAPPVLLSQVVVDSVTVEQTYASTVVGCDYSIGLGTPVRTFQGGGVAPGAGTF